MSSAPKTSMTKEEAAAAYSHDIKGYLTGFVLAVVLTVIPFGMVAMGGFGFGTVIGTIAVLGLIQMVVHVKYFLHVDFSADQREYLHLMLFSLLLLFIMAAGTIWILVNLQGRMMGM
ncbi:cytochrome o ubiquinol oxidase subunit IV [Solirhodobacter olei]|uniref:cytochrome o ubiquinol oxidase subunit IV n=1 Tax=Solirhodobacter olei TaxID=2493082 RepID=UPI0019D4A385|nr:cytochrome o ubiquinol oxidase subunit IV [Solirhodobacter olei]